MSTYSQPTVSHCPHVRTARSAVEANVTVAAMRATRRRSKASASIPPYSPATIIGSSPATAIIATAKVDPVSSYICSMTATIVSWPPSPASVEPIHIRVNAGLAAKRPQVDEVVAAQARHPR